MTPVLFRHLLLASLLALVAAPLAGCWAPGYYPGGPRASRDLFTFESTREFPQTIQVVDLTTNEVIWSISVPIGDQVVIRFYEDHDRRNVDRPTLMRWELMEQGTRFGELDNAIPVPSRDRRLMNVYHRERADVAPGLELGQSGE